MKKRSWLLFLHTSTLPPFPAHHPEPPTRWSLSPFVFVIGAFKSSELSFFSHFLYLFSPTSPPCFVHLSAGASSSRRHTDTHFLQQLPPHWTASAPPVVRLDWIQLGRLFTLPSLLLGPMRLLMPPPLPVPQSNTHLHTHSHSASICLNNFPPGGAF